MSKPQQSVLLLLFALVFLTCILLQLVMTDAPVMPLPTLANLQSQSTIVPDIVAKPVALAQGQEIIIQFTASQLAEEIDVILSQLEVEVVEVVPHVQGTVVVRSKETISSEQIKRLAPSVVIEPNYLIQSLLTLPTDDPMMGDQWALEALQVDDYWEQLDESTPRVVVSVIDSGTCADHEDLQGRILGNGYDFIDDDTDPSDRMGHGCAVSGILAANADNGIGMAGIAPQVDILPIRVLNQDGIGTYADLASAIYYAVDNGAEIINLSLGGQHHSYVLQQAVNHALDNHVDIVAGAGNSGQSGVFYPARYDGVIAVGSMDENGNRSSFSTYGDEVDTLAPGETILSTSLNGSYGSFTGTSMAVPHISGLLALSHSTGQVIDWSTIGQQTEQAEGSDDEIIALAATPTPVPPTAGPTPTASSTPAIAPDCATTDIQLDSFDENSISYQIEDVESANEYLIYMDHGLFSNFTPVSSTVALSNVTYNGEMVWQASGPDATSIDHGTWLSSPWLDNNTVTIHYDTSINFTEYFYIYEFLTRIFVHNSVLNVDCFFYPSYPPLPSDTPTNMSGTVIGSDVHLSWDDNATSETNYIVEQQVAGGKWEELPALPANTTSYVASGVCDVLVRWRVMAYYSDTDTYSLSSYPPEFTPPCPIAEPSNLTAISTVSGTQLNWDISAEGSYSHVQIYRQISGVDTNFVQIETLDEEATSYLDTTEFLCETSATYKVVLSRWDSNNGQYIHSDPAIAPFTAPACPRIDLAVTVSVSNTSPVTYEEVDFELSVINQSNETAHNTVIQISTIPESYFQFVSSTAGNYDGTESDWTIPEVAGNSSVSLTLRTRATVNPDDGEQTVIAELVATDAIDPDSTPNNGVVTEDDYDSQTITTICPATSVLNVGAGDTQGFIMAVGSANFESCFSGQVTIHLANDSTYEFSQRYDNDNGNIHYKLYQAFPSIASDMIIEGNGATLKSTTSNYMNAFYVEPTGSLELKHITISSFAGNQARGTALYNLGSLIVRNSTFEHITATYTVFEDQGIVPTLIEGSLFYRNYDEIVVASYDAVVRNNTFAENIHGGGALRVENEATIMFNTFYMNSGHALWLDQPAGASGNQIHLFGNLLYNPDRTRNCLNFSFDSLVNSLGYNISNTSENDCDFDHPTDEVYEPNLKLQYVFDNGGATRTSLPEVDSIAVDYIPAIDCSLSVDQRGFARPFNTNCDVGSVERQNALQKPTNLTAVPISGTTNVLVQWEDNTDSESEYVLLQGLTLNDDWEILATLPANTVSYTDITTDCTWSYHYQVRASHPINNQYSDSSNIVETVPIPCVTLQAPILTLTSASNIPFTDSRVELTWDDPNADADNYEIEFTENGGEWTSLTVTTADPIFHDLNCETDYTYRIRANRDIDNGSSAWSSAAPFTSGDCPTDISQTGPNFFVTSTDDTLGMCGGTYCTLRSAIEAANQQVGLNTIYLPQGIIKMQIAGRYEDNNQTGDFNVKDKLTIIGHVSGTTIDADHLDRHFELHGGVDFTLKNLIIINGELPNVFDNHNNPNQGGVIYADNTGRITLDSVIVTDNISVEGGVIFASYANEIIITNSHFERNHAYVGGGVMTLFYVPVTIENSDFISNTTDGSGGVYISNPLGSDAVHISDSTFLYNSATGAGGAIRSSDFTYIDNSLFEGNVSAAGGAISDSYISMITNSIFRNNYADLRGGAISITNPYFPSSIIDSSIIDNGAGENGGGIYGRNIFIQDTTVGNNSAGDNGGGIYMWGEMELRNATIAHNMAVNGIGGGLYIDNGGSTHGKITNSIIGDNTDSIGTTADCHGRPHEVRNSIIEYSIECNLVYDVLINSLFGQSPNISDLQTSYFLLLPGSPAINQADTTLCKTTDQLGNDHQVGGICDMGAVESIYTLNPPTNLTSTVSNFVDITLTWDDNSQHDQNIVVERSLNNSTWSTIATIPADSDTYQDIGLICPQAYYYRVSSRAGSYIEYSNTVFVELIEPCEALKFLTNLSATFIDESLAQIVWTDDNSDESGFRILRQISSSWSEIGVLDPNMTIFFDATINCQIDSTYDYQIQVYRNIDNTTADSTIASVWTGDCPINLPTLFNVSGVTDTQIELLWVDNSSLESAYVLSRSVNNTNWTVVATLPENTASFTDSAVECERTYYYQLQGYQALFDRYTNPVSTSATTSKCNVAIPDTITTTATTSQTQLTWNPLPPQQTTQITVERAEQVTGAVVSLSNDPPANWQIKAILPGGANVFTDDDLRCGMDYWYRIQGYNANHNEYSDHSDPIQITTSDCPVPVTNTIGLYQDGQWMFGDSFDHSAHIVAFRFGPQESGWIPLTGDWDGDGVDGIGLYKEGIFALRNVSERGVSDYVYRFGNAESGWQPIVGDWNGDGQDTIGLYRAGVFMLTNSHDSPDVDYQFVFGNRESSWTAIAGDWTAAGRDYVGIYKDGVFQLHDSFKTKATGKIFKFGPETHGWIPIAGDWDKDGITTIGLYKDNQWRLRNSNNRGQVDIGFTFGTFGNGAYPLASYRGGEEAVEALALFSEITLPDVDADPTDVPIALITATPTQIIVATDSVSPTAVESTPTVTSAVSATETFIEPTLTLTPTQEPTIAPTSTPTASPTMTQAPTLIPTLLPSATPTAVPTEALIEPTEPQNNPEITEEAASE